MAKKHFNLLLICLTAFSLQLYAQTASFTVSSDKGCYSVKAQFANTSTGFSAGAVYTLNFGEGASVPFLPADILTHSYLTGGSYTATLTVTDGGKTFTATHPVTVYKAPVVNFAPNIGKVCANGSITFTSTSTPGDGTISNYLWDFGDGNITDTTTGTVNHIYTSGSTIKAGLTVTNSFGCMTSVTLPNVVTVLAAPSAAFSTSATTLCRITDGVSFTNTTTGGATPATYLWSFGDGTTSNSVNAVHSYATKGSYTAKLIATSSEGCTDTSAGTVITVASTKSGITAPSSFCANTPFTFTDNSSPQTANPVWLLDGVEVANAVHQYTASFTDTALHTLQLLNVYGTCTDTATQTVQAKPSPKALPFTYHLNGFCNATTPSASFTETATGTVKWEWDFNNVVDSIFKPTVFTQNPTYIYSAAGTYKVKLRITDASGCTSTITQPVTIAKTTTTVTSTEGVFGCHNLTTTFKATSTLPIAQYNWMFSDDNSTSTVDTPQHTFPNIGTYSAFVKIKTTSGCTDTARMKVYIGDEPNFNFAVVNPGDITVCGNKQISFKVTGNPDSLVGSYYWDFGDAGGVYTPVKGDSIYTHKYLTDGDFTVSLAIKNHGCNDTLTKINYIKVIPPFAKISATAYNCNDRLKVVLKESSIKAQTYSWNFGDKSATYDYTAASRDTAVVHYFPNTGSFNTVLTTTNGSCVSKDSLWVRVIKNQTPVLSSIQTLLCANDTLHTLVSGMDANPLGYQPAYVVKAVQYDDTTKFAGAFTMYDNKYQNPFHINISKLKKGKDSIRLITASNGFGCLDTTNFISVQVNGPTAGFTIANNTPCLSDKVVFTDISKGDGISPIKSRTWLYGDSTVDTLSKGGKVSHQYLNPGTYKVKLITTDASHCTDTAYYPTNDVTVKGPQAKFTVAQNPILPNATETFVNSTDSGKAIRTNNTYTWQFGDGTNAASTKDSITHIYKQYSDDTVTLTATSSVTGCTNIASSVVHVKNTNLRFIYTTKYLNPASTCPPLLISFTNKSINFKSISWDFGDSLTAGNVATPTHTYYKPGVYKVIIYGYYPNNTYDSSWEYINIAGPSATLSANALTGCGSRDVVFTAKTNNSASLLWDFGDGTSSTDSVAHHVYRTPNVYMPTLTVKDSMQCSASYSLATPVAIDSLHISLRKDSLLQCHQMEVNFIPTAFSIAGSNKQTLTYTWQFGNGSNASSKDTGTATYTHSGVYPVSLITTSPYGCKDTITTQVSYTDVHFASINGLSEFCENTPIAFSAVKTNPADVLTYKWQFQKDSSTLQNPPVQSFSASGNNTITLWLNKNGCNDTLYQKLTIHPSPDVTILVSDPVVCLGSAVAFDAKPKNSTDTLHYFWNLGDGKDSAAVKSASFTYAAAGTYPVLLRTTSNFGCKQELQDTVVVSPTPNVFINAPIDLCKNGTVTFTSVSTTATLPNFLWHFTDGTTSTKQNPEPKTYNAAGVNNIYLVASIGNCYDTVHHQLTVHDEPLVNLTASAQRVCFGDSVQLTAHNGKTYQWTINNVAVNLTNPANPHTLPYADTKYSVLAIDNFGCKNSDSLTVRVTKKQQLAVKAPVVNVCAGNKVSLAASGTDVYNWINGTDLTATNIANPSTVDSAQNKTYTVVGSDAYGCFTDTARVQVIVRNNPVIQMANNSNNITTPVGAPTPLMATSASNIVKWNWQPALFLSCNNCDAPTSKPRQNIHYQVEGTDGYGCKGSDTLAITVVCSGSTIGIPEAFSPNGDGRNDRFGVSGYGIKNIKHFVIFARNGNKVFERNNVSPYDVNGQWDGMCNNAYMPTGTYVYIIEATCDAGEAYNVKGTVTLIR